MKKTDINTTNTVRTRRVNPRIIIVPHYIGTDKAEDVLKKVITDEIKKKIEKTA